MTFSIDSMVSVNKNKIKPGGKEKSADESVAKSAQIWLEEGLTACRFGRFHIRFLFTLMISNIANVLVSADSSYLLPNAECDLNMSIYQKGILNAMAYIGMLTSGFFAGFLTDTFGRRPFLIYGYLGMFLCCLMEGSSQHYETLLTAKFLQGFVFSAAFNAMVAMCSEITSIKHRDRIMLMSSSFIAFAHISVALFSWAILPNNIRITFANGAFVLSSWNIYLYACGIFSLTACILYCFVKESPKYLVYHGHPERALRVLRAIYAENTGQPPENFPVQSVAAKTNATSATVRGQSFFQKVSAGFSDTKPIFKRPLVLYLMLICAMQVMTMLVYNVLRLWYPQLSTIIEHYSKKHNASSDLCTMLDSYMADNVAAEKNRTLPGGVCVPHLSGTETYVNSIIMGTVCVIPYIITTTLINKVDKRLLLLISLSIGCACVASLGYATSSTIVVALISTTVALTQTVVSLNQTIVVEIFPTVNRSMAISLMMMAGRTGTLIGNVLFPILLAQGCQVPFFSIAGLLFFVIVLSTLLPKKGTT